MRRTNDWRFRVLLTSDRHIDSPDSDWDLQKEHLNQARKFGAPVLDAGDLFDYCGGKNDKRRSKSGVRPEHSTDTYIDDVIATTAEMLAPWADIIPIILSGNHEHSLVEHLETSVSERLIERLKILTGAEVYHGGYGAAITFSFVDEKGKTRSVNLWMEHGAGGGGPVTGDMIAMYRRSTYLPDFNIVASGHTHDQAYRKLQRLRLSAYGKLSEDTMHLVKLATYKREFREGHGGWHTRRGAPPKPRGAWWIEFSWCHRTERVVVKLIEA
jgi:predicted phosphodiesterase